MLHLFNHPETYGEFSHKAGKRYSDFKEILKEIEAETDRVCGANKGISMHPILLKIYSPKVSQLRNIATGATGATRGAEWCFFFCELQ